MEICPSLCQPCTSPPSRYLPLLPFSTLLGTLAESGTNNRKGRRLTLYTPRKPSPSPFPTKQSGHAQLTCLTVLPGSWSMISSHPAFCQPCFVVLPQSNSSGSAVLALTHPALVPFEAPRAHSFVPQISVRGQRMPPIPLQLSPKDALAHQSLCMMTVKIA